MRHNVGRESKAVFHCILEIGINACNQRECVCFACEGEKHVREIEREFVCVCERETQRETEREFVCV